MNVGTLEAGELILRARHGDPQALGLLLEARRSILVTLAERRLGGRIAARVDPSDVVQLTLMEAHRDFGRFRGGDEPELVAWLERILSHNVAATIRDHTHAQRRDLRRERSLERPPGDGPGFAALESDLSSPSQRVVRGEDEARLARALAGLPDDQRRAVQLRHLEGRSLAEVSEALGRSPTAAAGLIKRGIQTLRRAFREAQD